MTLKKNLTCRGSKLAALIVVFVILFLISGCAGLYNPRNPFIKAIDTASAALSNRKEIFVADIVGALTCRLLSEKGWGDKSLFNRGRVLGLFEATTIIQEIAKKKGIDLDKIGLDIDLEELMNDLI